MINLFVWIFIFLSLFSSCVKKGPPTLEKKGSQTIHINYFYAPFSVDPRKGTDPVTTVMSYMLYEGLTRLDADGTTIPALSKRVTISKDRKEYLFFLRKSMWSDGTPLTAYHFVASWKQILRPDFPSKAAHLLFPIKNAKEAKLGLCAVDEVGIEAIDEHTLLVRLTRPTPYFLQLTAYPTYFPMPYNGDEVSHPHQHHNLLTNGPFRLSMWKDDNEIVTVKNPYYWNAQEVKLNAIHATIISDEATALKLFEQGKIDYLGGLLSPLPLDALSTLKKTKRLKKTAIAATTFAVFNLNQFPFNNVHIRKAFAYAVNKQDIIEHISQMFDEVASGPVPPVVKGTTEIIYDTYNHEAALHHFDIGLQELGITRKQLPTITYCYFNADIQRNLALALQSQWKEVLGVEVQLQTSDLKSHLAKLHKHQFQISQMSWIGQYHDRMCFLERFFSKKGFANYSGWENPLYQQLIEDSCYQENEKRVEILEEAEHMLMDEMPIIPIYHYHSIYIKNPHLKKLSISPMGDVQFHKAYFQ